MIEGNLKGSSLPEKREYNRIRSIKVYSTRQRKLNLRHVQSIHHEHFFFQITVSGRLLRIENSACRIVLKVVLAIGIVVVVVVVVVVAVASSSSSDGGGSGSSFSIPTTTSNGHRRKENKSNSGGCSNGGLWS